MDGLTVVKKVRDEVLTKPERWTKCALGAGDDMMEYPHCLVGAVDRVLGGHYCKRPAPVGAREAVELLWLAIYNGASLDPRRSLAVLAADVEDWQDAPKRTFEEIRAVLDRAVALGEQGSER